MTRSPRCVDDDGVGLHERKRGLVNQVCTIKVRIEDIIRVLEQTPCVLVKCTAQNNDVGFTQKLL